MTRGRIAWNVVTSYSNSAAKAMGLDAVIPTLERYAAAQEFMELIYQYDKLSSSRAFSGARARFLT